MISAEQYNFPSNLRVFPSESRSGSNSDYAALQDVDTFGIAGRIWEASYALLAYLSSQSTSLIEYSPPSPLAAARTPYRIIDLGAGTGNLSLSLLPRLQRDDVMVMTDMESVLPLLRRNTADWEKTESATGSEISTILVQRLEWGREGDVDRLLNTLNKYPRDTTLIIASDLIYFEVLYPPLIRTLLDLTNTNGGGEKRIVMSYKVRSLVKEMPFWQAFGKFFVFYPVLSRRLAPLDSASGEAAEPKSDRDSDWTVLGSEEEIFVFICERRSETMDCDIPLQTVEGDAELMRGGDDQFEMLLMNALEL